MVGENNLNVQVGNLRRLLGADAIVTVAGPGPALWPRVNSEGPLRLALPERPSVAILPFETSGGTRPRLARRRLVEDITTELSRFRYPFVVAQLAFVYRAMPRDLRAVSRDLNVRYLVEAACGPGSDRVRVTAQLIDAGDGGHVWAENFDRAMADTSTRRRGSRAPS